MALLICSLLMGLQSVPGIIKPYSKGVVQFLTKVPEKQKSKDSTLLRNSAQPRAILSEHKPAFHRPTSRSSKKRAD